MQKKQHEEILCRFCLSETAEQNNPFLAPCNCSGSVKFVHLFCLNRWRNQNTERNYQICNLCHSEYILPKEYCLEKLPEHSWLFIILDYPILTNLTGHYIWAVTIGLNSGSNLDAFTTYICTQLIYHLYYFVSIWLHWRVQKRERYWNAWKKEYRTLFFPSYGLLFLFAALSNNPFTWVVPSIYVTMGWHLHMQILKEMNQYDLRQIEEVQ
jgi:hypothetical protein